MALAGLAAPTGAPAAETIGQTGPGVMCPDATSYFQFAVNTPPGYAATAPGVITSYSTESGPMLKTRELIVLAFASGNNWSVVRKDSVRAATAPNVINTFSGLHIPIAAGERVGYFIPDQTVDGGDCLTYGVVPGDQYRHAAGEPPLGVPTYFGAFATGGRINLSATVEPDADGDGFGDETQDGCLGNGAATGACPVATPPVTAPKRTKCKKKKRKKHAQAARKRCKKPNKRR